MRPLAGGKQMKTNEKGQVLIVDIEKYIKKSFFEDDKTDKIKWIKTVEGLDETKTNGYSIEGYFVKKEIPKWVYPGSLLLLRIDGYDCYHLGVIKKESFKIIKTVKSEGKKWAVEFWDTINDNLQRIKPNNFNPLSKITDEKLIKELTTRGFVIFDKTNEKKINVDLTKERCLEMD